MKKFHAYPKLLLAVGALTLSAFSGSAAFASDASALAVERTVSAEATADETHAGPAVQKNLLRLLGKQPSNKAVICGDSEPDIGEECDDGNLSNGDGCDSTCLVEAGSNCTLAIAGQASENIIGDGSFEEDDGTWTIIGSAFDPVCNILACGPDLATDGDNYLWIGGGFTDNGNDATATQTIVIPANATSLTFEWASGSGALPQGTCESPAADLLEVLIDGTQVFRSPNPCEEIFPFQTETIDLVALGLNDGAAHTIQFHGINVDAGVGTSLTNFFLDNVRLEVPANPPIPPVPSSCLVGVCGDGIFSSGEACDDGNLTAGDGCSATCAIESVDFVCSDPLYNAFDFLPSGATPTGDAIVEGSLEDGRGRISNAWTEIVEPDMDEFADLAPICSEVFCSFISINIASDGIFYGLFGASADPSNTAISQTTTIPVGANTLTFDFFAATPAVGACDSGDDFLEVTVDGIQVYVYDCVTPITEYTEQTADISAFADGGDHEIIVRGVTFSTNTQNTNFFVDNISIPLPTAADPVANASTCFLRDTSCAPVETFDAGIPAGWTVINPGPDPADGWGTTGDGTCLAENAAGVGGSGGDNLTTGTGGAACADSDATGQVDIDGGGPALEMESFLCSPALDLQTITGPSYSFNTYYASANNQFNDNGTPEDFADDFDEDLLEVLVGTTAPNALTISNYTRLGGVNDHEDGNLFLTGAQELSANLEGTLEGEQEGYVCFRYLGTFAWFAQIDNAGLRGEDCNLAPVDTDGDGVFDSTDNCTDVVNPDQIDTNGDGIGNRCDADVDNNCIVNFQDIAAFVPRFNTGTGNPLYDENFDINSSGSLNFQDYIVYTQAFQMPPGPSANACVPGLGT